MPWQRASAGLAGPVRGSAEVSQPASQPGLDRPPGWLAAGWPPPARPELEASDWPTSRGGDGGREVGGQDG